ncbi:hypothetical protein HY412_02605 [Candidatus Kaiserbacteria bacterium]|nr:hypothetical protein [Candidatus Kaiserbacteria bacterium]
MKRVLIVLLIVLLLPASVMAARAPSSFSAARSLIADSSSQGNSYAAGFSIVRTAPVTGDFLALSGSVVTAAPVSGDEILIAGSINSRAKVGGDFRAVGGSINIEESITGDLVAFGFSVRDSGRAGGSVFIIAANTVLTGGASGPVTVYGNDVSLDGNFAGDVNVIASGKVALAASTTIFGKLSYQSPEPADIPESVIVSGGIEYTSASYLPNVGTSRILAFMSIGFFLFVRILGALILAGLLAGLFPKLAEMVVERAMMKRPSSILLTTLLGFAVFIVTPVLFLLLALTFVGIGLAFLLSIGYVFIVFLSLVYAGILIGGMFSRRYMRRETILWHDGVLGMLVLSLISLVPFAGLLMVFLIAAFSAGSLLLIFFYFAFSRDEHTSEML